VAIREDVGTDGDVLTDCSFDRKSTGVDLRPDPFDDDTTTAALVTRPGTLSRRVVGPYPESLSTSLGASRVANPGLDAIHYRITWSAIRSSISTTS
jgi:hypothetical protein